MGSTVIVAAFSSCMGVETSDKICQLIPHFMTLELTFEKGSGAAQAGTARLTIGLRIFLF